MIPSVRCHTQGFLPEKPRHVFVESKGMRVSKGVYHVVFVFYIFMLQCTAVDKQKKLKCNVRGHFLSIRPDSRCSGVPRINICGNILIFCVIWAQFTFTSSSVQCIHLTTVKLLMQSDGWSTYFSGSSDSLPVGGRDSCVYCAPLTSGLPLAVKAALHQALPTRWCLFTFTAMC